MTIENGATAMTTVLLLVGALNSTTFGKLALDDGTMTVTGTSGALFDPNSHLEFTLHDKADPAALAVTHGLTITNSILNIQLRPLFSAAVNDVFTIASYGSRTGTFAGLAEGATIIVDDYSFKIGYGTVITNAITLSATAIP